MDSEQCFDTLTFSHQLYDDTSRQLEFSATSVAEAEEWQRLVGESMM